MNDNAKQTLEFDDLCDIISYNWLCKYKTNIPNNEHIGKLINAYSIKNNILKNLFPPAENINGNLPAKDRRIVVIVGAGASKDADLPDAGEAAKKVLSRISLEGNDCPQKNGKQFDTNEKNKIDNIQGLLPCKVYNDELQRIKRFHHTAETSFESKMQALSKYRYIEEKVISSLKNLFQLRYFPVLSYEILAHLFKQRAIDVIINFNFDELLDQAIADELREDQYSYIVHEGNCEDYQKDSRKHRKPIYIKPHGTVNNPSTMRFTREDYFDLSSPLKRCLDEIIQDATVYIILGFGMESIEFNLLLKDSIVKNKKERAVFVIDKSPKEDADKLFELIENAAFSFPFYGYIEVANVGGNNPASISHALKSIMSEITKRLSDDIIPKIENFPKFIKPSDIFPSVERHELFSKLFNSNTDIKMPKTYQTSYREAFYTFSDIHCKKIDTWLLPDYLYIRSLIELCLFMAANKGRINLVLANKSRAGHYFQLYRKEVWEEYYGEKKRKRIGEHIDPINFQTLKQLCDILDFQKTGSSFGIYECKFLLKESGEIAEKAKKLLNKLCTALNFKRRKNENISGENSSNTNTHSGNHLHNKSTQKNKKKGTIYYCHPKNKLKKKYINSIRNKLLSDENTRNTIIELIIKEYKSPNKRVEPYSEGLIPDLLSTESYSVLRSRLSLKLVINDILKKDKPTHLFLLTQDPGWIFDEDILRHLSSNNPNIIIRCVYVTDNSNVFGRLKNNFKVKNVVNRKIYWTEHKRFLIMTFTNPPPCPPDRIIYYDQSHFSSEIVPFTMPPIGVTPNSLTRLRKEEYLEACHTFINVFSTYWEKNSKKIEMADLDSILSAKE